MLTDDLRNAFSLSHADRLRELCDLVQDGVDDWGKIVEADDPTLVTFVNPLSVRTILVHPDFLDVLRRFHLVLADGMLLAAACSLVHRRPVNRAAFDGNSIAPAILEACRRAGKPVCLVGGPPGAAEASASLFARAFGVTVVGAHAGYFPDPGARAAVLETIRATAVPVVIVGMGTYLQERFLLDLIATGWRGHGFTCGAYLAQAARGRVAYYPPLIDRLQLRALFRTLQDPRRFGERYLLHYLPFYVAAFRLWYGQKMTWPARTAPPRRRFLDRERGAR